MVPLQIVVLYQKSKDDKRNSSKDEFHKRGSFKKPQNSAVNGIGAFGRGVEVSHAVSVDHLEKYENSEGIIITVKEELQSI